MKPLYPLPIDVSTTEARTQLPRLIHLVQHPERNVLLTRHGKVMAALVSFEDYQRINRQVDMENFMHRGWKPSSFLWGRNWRGRTTQAQQAEKVQQIQFDRAMERSVLKHAGLEPVPGGELMLSMAEVRGRTWPWWLRPFRRLIRRKVRVVPTDKNGAEA
ncbi:type II toxin-antitoxin system Phd/YefM family antitoxin [Tropicimonas sp. S265A]|uniref:type II toxin-antitoxin system Phd/YefM family antitoxin n=1 Tax=Tropicimonas sp. S265A TaxID=3415134 RepID=UPI003C7E573A